jgi:ferrochelatase
MSYEAVLLIAFGGPEKIEDVRPFLANVTKGRPISPHRLEEVARHYELFGGCSPLNDITFRQAKALQALLECGGLSLPVYVGMRNWRPSLHETLERMASDGIQRALGFILSAQQSEAGWDRYQQNVAEARELVGSRAPRVEYIPGWHNHPLFIEAVADLTRRAFEQIAKEHRRETPLVFTAHSIPIALPSTPIYVRQVEEGARLVAERLRQEWWLVAYQSRSGDPRMPWLEPDIGFVLQKLAAEGACNLVVSPIGFVCDHIEVLYDLDTEAKRIASAQGLTMIRAETVNDHPTFIRMMADVVQKMVTL